MVLSNVASVIGRNSYVVFVPRDIGIRIRMRKARHYEFFIFILINPWMKKYNFRDKYGLNSSSLKISPLKQFIRP